MKIKGENELAYHLEKEFRLFSFGFYQMINGTKFYFEIIQKFGIYRRLFNSIPLNYLFLDQKIITLLNC